MQRSQKCNIWKSIHQIKNEGFPLRIYSVNETKSGGNADLVTFTKEILNEKLYFLFGEGSSKQMVVKFPGCFSALNLVKIIRGVFNTLPSIRDEAFCL